MNLSYSGQVRLDEQIDSQAKAMLDALLSADAADDPVSVDSGQVRPRDDHAVLIVSLSATGDLSVLESVRDDLAQAVVDLGLEPDIVTAEDAITISS